MDAPVREAQDTDRRLLDAVAAGDQSALEELYTRHGHALPAYAEGVLADRQRAEEALQDTLLAAWRGAAAFEGRSTVRTWLFGICRRQALPADARPRPGPHPDRRCRRPPLRRPRTGGPLNRGRADAAAWWVAGVGRIARVALMRQHATVVTAA
jgi:hypothetical protein